MAVKNFFHTTNIIKALNETAFGVTAPTKMDTGVDSSSSWQTAKQTAATWMQSAFKKNSDPGQFSMYLAKPHKHSEQALKLSQILFDKSVRRVPVYWLALMGKPAVEGISQTVTFNYIFLTENLYKSHPKFYQSTGDSRVYVDYKNVLATTVESGNMGSFLQGAAGSFSNRAYSYIKAKGPTIFNQFKSHALSMFQYPADKEFIEDFLDNVNDLPVAIYDSVTLGIVDSANVAVKSTRQFSSSSKYIVADHLAGKERLILDTMPSLTHEDAGMFQVLPNNVKTDLHQKLSELVSDQGPYGSYTQDFVMAYDIAKRNPLRAYGTVFKGCIQHSNWILNDLNTTIGNPGNPSIFFSNASEEEVYDAFGNGKTRQKDSLPFAVVRTVANYENFPLQVRCLSVGMVARDQKYDDNKLNKTVAIPFAFHQFIQAKMRELNKPNTPEEYLKTISDTLFMTETASIKGYEAGTSLLRMIFSQCYTGEGSFASKILFRYVPQILLDHHYLTTSINSDLSQRPLAYLDRLDSLEAEDGQYAGMARYSRNAAMTLFAPIDSEGRWITPPDMSSMIDTEFADAAQEDITKDFISFGQLHNMLYEKLGSVENSGQLHELANIFALAVKNVANGFWSTTPDGPPQAAAVLSAGKRLGMFNPFVKSTSLNALPFGVITPVIDDKLIQGDYLRRAREAGVKQAMKKLGVSSNDSE